MGELVGTWICRHDPKVRCRWCRYGHIAMGIAVVILSGCGSMRTVEYRKMEELRKAIPACAWNDTCTARPGMFKALTEVE